MKRSEIISFTGSITAAMELISQEVIADGGEAVRIVDTEGGSTYTFNLTCGGVGVIEAVKSTLVWLWCWRSSTVGDRHIFYVPPAHALDVITPIFTPSEVAGHSRRRTSTRVPAAQVSAGARWCYAQMRRHEGFTDLGEWDELSEEQKGFFQHLTTHLAQVLATTSAQDEYRRNFAASAKVWSPE